MACAGINFFEKDFLEIFSSQTIWKILKYWPNKFPQVFSSRTNRIKIKSPHRLRKIFGFWDDFLIPSSAFHFNNGALQIFVLKFLIKSSVFNKILNNQHFITKIWLWPGLNDGLRGKYANFRVPQQFIPLMMSKVDYRSVVKLLFKSGRINNYCGLFSFDF